VIIMTTSKYLVWLLGSIAAIWLAIGCGTVPTQPSKSPRASSFSPSQMAPDSVAQYAAS
jgi:hypothetical protein